MARKVKTKTAKAVKTTKAGQAAIAGLQEAIAYMRGEDVPGIVVHKPVDVAAVRKKTGLSQDKFAAKYGLDVSALRAWEQHTRTPERGTQLYLRMIQREPEAVERALKSA